VNPKIDASQRRLQCSLRFDDFFKHLAPGGVSGAAGQTQGVWHSGPPQFESAPRKLSSPMNAKELRLQLDTRIFPLNILAVSSGLLTNRPKQAFYMKFTISKESFLDAINQVQHVVSSRTTLAILSNVLLKAKDGVLELTTTDLDVGVTCSVPCEVMNPVPPRFRPAVSPPSCANCPPRTSS
jgi:hypothetical protein